MKLASDEVCLHFSYPEKITDPGLLRQYKSLLSELELLQMSRFHFPRHQHQYLITRALVRSSLSIYYHTEPDEWEFGKNRFGKPEISCPDRQSKIGFNLSHTHGLILCGIVRNFQIGVDIENQLRPTFLDYETLSRHFSVQETQALLKLPAKQRKQRFFDLWTLKESYIKARGHGLSIPLDKFSFKFKNNVLSDFSIHPDLNDDASNWQFWRIPMDEKYRIAVAIKGGNHAIGIRAINSVPLQSNKPTSLAFL